MTSNVGDSLLENRFIKSYEPILSVVPYHHKKVQGVITPEMIREF